MPFHLETWRSVSRTEGSAPPGRAGVQPTEVWTGDDDEGFFGVALMLVACCLFGPSLRRTGRGALRRRGREGEGDDTLQRLDETMGRLAEEVGALRGEVAELAERVDFTERALAALRRNAVGAGHGS